jgi:electron transfer flavoprotein beta subunit
MPHSMNIIVCIKQVPGTTQVKVDPLTGVLIRSGIDTKMNPYDLFAVETAVRLKEHLGASVRAITMGPPQAAEILHEAMWMGVDEGTLLTDRRFAGADCLATAFALSQAVRVAGMPDLIVCGKQTTDGDTAQVGAELAEFLDIPHATNVRKIVSVKEHSIVVEMDLPEQVQVVELDFPCLITVEKGIVQPRLPSYRRKLALQKHPIQTLKLDDLQVQEESKYGLNGSPTRVMRIFPPESHTQSETWSGPAPEIAEKLSAMLSAKKLI